MWYTYNRRTLSRVVCTTKDLTCLKQWYVLWYKDILSASVTATLTPVIIIAWDSFMKRLTFYIFTAMYKSSSFLTDICFYQLFSSGQFSLQELLFHCAFNFHYKQYYWAGWPSHLIATHPCPCYLPDILYLISIFFS